MPNPGALLRWYTARLAFLAAERQLADASKTMDTAERELAAEVARARGDSNQAPAGVPAAPDINHQPAPAGGRPPGMSDDEFLLWSLQGGPLGGM
jgi:hypothetical protein